MNLARGRYYAKILRAAIMWTNFVEGFVSKPLSLSNMVKLLCNMHQSIRISKSFQNWGQVTNTNNKKDAPLNEKQFIGLKCMENVCRWLISCLCFTTWLIPPLLQSPFASGVALMTRDCNGIWLSNHPRFVASLLWPQHDRLTNQPTIQWPTNQWTNQPMGRHTLLCRCDSRT